MDAAAGLKTRGSGILLHITSLPCKFGIGDFGPQARQFAEFLCQAGQRYWQILPLNPTDPMHGNSPYHSVSAFALNPLFISPEILAAEGWISESDSDWASVSLNGPADYSRANALKTELLEKAFLNFSSTGKQEREYSTFCDKNRYWLDDYAMYVSLKSFFGGKAWAEWPPELRDRDVAALNAAKDQLRDEIEKMRFSQFLLRSQWQSLKSFCNSIGVRLIGDIPIYVVHDSADVWANPDLFNLDEQKMPRTVAGVPPDYFSPTGQLWGNPVFRWDVLRARDYQWWLQRIGYNLQLYDVVRIDHFRGFVAYWEVPSGEKTATNGRWVEVPAWSFFKRIKAEFGQLPVIAEDLGVITPDVVEVRRHFGFPGMKILLFAFDENLPTNPYAPHNLGKDCVVYTGTHDNNTVKGWFEREASRDQKERVFRYLGRKADATEIHMEFLRLAMMSVANTAIFPMQDLLGLGEEARMNRPASNEGNWKWRLYPEQVSESLSEQLRDMTEIYGRL